MPLQRTSLASFLTAAKQALNSGIRNKTPVTLVVGNESADLDSLCSAVVFAYLRTYSSGSVVEGIQVPLSNLPRGDLSLRPELRPVLSSARLKVESLITLSDLEPSGTRVSSLDPVRTKWVLVDHNALQGDLGSVYGSRVVGAIDHHDEENQVPKDCGSEPRVITKSGSCMSLVIEYYRGAWDEMTTTSATDEAALWDAEVAQVALAPILIDTTNLKSASKVTPTDIQAVEYLEAKIRAVSIAPYSRDDYFEQISQAKADIGDLSLEDILRKDYKQWTEAHSVNLGISSVVKPMAFLLQKAEGHEAFLARLHQFAADRKLTIYAIMTTSSTAGVFRRELFTYALDGFGADTAMAFGQSAAETLGLRQWEEGKLDGDGSYQAQAQNQDKDQDQDQLGWRRCWVQERIENSRKQVGPLLRKAVHETSDARR